LSILLNVILGGKPHQTFSARNYGWKRDGKYHMVELIDFIFYWCGYIRNFLLTRALKRDNVSTSSHHCLHSWVVWRTRKDIIHEMSGEIQDGKRKEPWGQVRVQRDSQQREKRHSHGDETDRVWRGSNAQSETSMGQGPESVADYRKSR